MLIRTAVDCRVPLPPDAYGERPLPDGMVKIINPADWIALGLALDLVKRGFFHSAGVAVLGGIDVEKSLRRCLAAGAGEAVRIEDEGLEDSDMLGKGTALAAAVREWKPSLVLTGDQCIDQLNTLLPGAVAAAAGMTFVTGIIEIEKVDAKEATVIRRAGRGKRERLLVRLPALMAVAEAADCSCPGSAGLPEVISACTAEIPCTNVDFPGAGQGKCTLIGSKFYGVTVKAATPPVVKPFTPDCRLSAEQRLRSILAGSSREKHGEIVSGTPEQIADRIVKFFREGAVKNQ